MAERGKRVLDEGEEQSVKKKIKKSVDITIGGIFTIERTQPEIEIKELIDKFLTEKGLSSSKKIKDEKLALMHKIVDMLKSHGYDATVSTTTGNSREAGEFPSIYEYTTLIDIKLDENHIFVDVDFASTFWVLEGTPEYRDIFCKVPTIFLARESAFKYVVRGLSAKREQSELVRAIRSDVGLASEGFPFG